MRNKFSRTQNEHHMKFSIKNHGLRLILMNNFILIPKDRRNIAYTSQKNDTSCIGWIREMLHTCRESAAAQS